MAKNVRTCKETLAEGIFPTLPDEIWKHMFGFCTFEDVVFSKQVCKKWNDVCNPILEEKAHNYFSNRLKGMEFRFNTKQKNISYGTVLHFRTTPAAYIRKVSADDKTIEVYFSPQEKVVIPPTVERLKEAFSDDPTVRLWMSDGRAGGTYV